MTATTAAHVSDGSTSAMIANGAKQHKNAMTIQIASLMRQTFLMRGFNWFAGISLIYVLPFLKPAIDAKRPRIS